MKKIMILYKNGTVKSKKESKITKDDIKNAEYFLISVSENSETYTMIKPSKYVLFTKAIIDYQLCMFYTEDDYDDVGMQPINPVHCETSSLCDVIGLLNSIDRLTVANELMNPDSIADYATSIGVCYFNLQLLDESDVIYDETYMLKGYYGPMFDPYQVVKHFKKFYTNTIISSFYTHQESLFLYIKGDEIRWDISKKSSKYELIGIFSPTSNTVTLLTKYQYKYLLEHKYMELHLWIYYEKNNFIETMSEMINEGYTTKERRRLFHNMNDIYFDDYKLLSAYQHPTEKMINIVANIVFTLDIIYLIYSEVYGPYGSENMKDYDFDVIITFTLAHDSKSDKRIEFSMNKYSIISIDTILNNLD